MYQKDYILRMIEMLGELLRAIFGMIEKGNLEQAEIKINEAYLTMLRKDSAFFQNIPVEKFTDTLIEEHNYTHSHLEILAELLFAEATLIYNSNDKKTSSLPFYKKSLMLFNFIARSDKTYSETRNETIKEIERKIDELI